MRIAYIISAYKLPQQLVRLVERLDAEGASFFIHVDQKTSRAAFVGMSEPLARRANVVFLERHRCSWGGFGHVEASLKGLRALQDEAVQFDYAVLLTGQDYPIKSNAQIHGFFAESGGRSFLEYFPLPHPAWPGHGGLDRFLQWHFFPFGRHVALPAIRPRRFGRAQGRGTGPVAPLAVEHALPKNWIPHGGSSYWCLSRECVEYVQRFLNDNPWVERYFRHTWVPDELFFQTILLNSPLKNRLVNDNLRYIQWTRGAPSPDVLSVADYRSLARSTQLFARKIDESVEPGILDLIDRNLL